MTRIFFAFFALAALYFAAATPGLAQKKDPSIAFVQQLGDQALSSLTAPDLAAAEREARVRRLLRSNFDIDTIARFSLGTYWRTATGAEKQEFMNLFEDMIVKTYAQRFSEYSGQSFTVTDSMPAGSKDMIVQSKIVQKNGPPVHVDWRLRPTAGGMRVIDVIVEDISMSVTQRSDFAAVIQQGGGTVAALNNSLRERIQTAKK
jgi:phospholipid transport system substrate-binding protein